MNAGLIKFDYLDQILKNQRQPTEFIEDRKLFTIYWGEFSTFGFINS